MRAKKAPTQRQLRVDEEIRHVIADMLIRDETFIEGLKSTMLMITEVNVSPDFSVADVFVRSVMGNDTNEQVALLNENKGVFRYQVGKKIRLRIVPDLRFKADETFEQAAHINDLLNSPRVKADLEKYKDK